MWNSTSQYNKGPASLERMELCPDCASCLVYPISWQETSNDRWQIELRCPDCEWAVNGVFEHEDVERFDHVLNQGTDVLVDGLTILTRHNMEQYAARFLTALQGDHLLPEDF